MLQIIKVWETSKGTFDSETFALMKCNREKDTDPRSPGFGQRETPKEVFVLKDEGSNKYFKLTEIEVI